MIFSKHFHLWPLLLLAVAPICICYCTSGARRLSTGCSKSLKNNLELSFGETFLKKRSSSRLMMGNWWDDDLPNILGINPIEAAILFGILYYVYGPVVLYDYAREAGKAVSTFVPIIRDVSTDIFNEFRENMEENKEMDELRKQGVDLSNYRKRTTNIFERFQAELEVAYIYRYLMKY